MKRNFKIILIAVLLVTAPLLMFAQNPPHPNGGVNGPGGGPVGGGAPIGNGVILLVAMGAAYGARKLYQMQRSASVPD
jgi:hypothetical protein